MLRLNPGDNQGIRYMLLTALLDRGHDAETEALFDRYGEDGAAAWLWGRVLFAFRRHGDSPATRDLLTVARKGNPQVVDYLLERKRLPAQRPDYITWGGEDEAQECARDARGAWQGTPGALAWMEAVVGGDIASATTRPRRSSGRKKTDGP